MNCFCFRIDWFCLVSLFLIFGQCGSSDNSGTEDSGVADVAPDSSIDVGFRCGYIPTCETDGDCVAACGGSKCHFNAGLNKNTCGCAEDSHCALSPYGSYCEPALKECTCSNNSQCATSSYGAYCDTDSISCGCSDNSHCVTADTGAFCDTANYFCICKVNSDCSVSKMGRVCLNERCRCQTSADCPSPDQQFCRKNLCFAKCQSDSDCTPYLGKGFTCRQSDKSCIECEDNNACQSNENGSKCLNNACGCETTSDCPTDMECYYGSCVETY